jgi:outer membrane murein-binding lipoprotein Lpp
MEISQQLDQLSEYQSQVEYLALKKQELLNEVKIPAEVLSAQDEANKARQRLDNEFWTRQKAREEAKKAMLAEIVDPPMPPEFVAALAAARQKRVAIEAQFSQDGMSDQQKAQNAKAKIDADLQSKVADVYAQVEARKHEITIEFSGQVEAANENIAELTEEIKAAVVQCGKAVKGQWLQAVYVKGRTSWNTDMLEGLIVVFPELEKARKVGEPSVSIRKI